MFVKLPEGVQISLYVQPRASRTEVVGEHNGALKIKIQSPPIDGKANEEIVSFLSELLKIPKKQIEILKGDKSRTKKVLVHALDIDQVRSALISS